MTGNPLRMPQSERRGGALGTAAWNRHASAPVTVQPKHISSGAMVTEEVELNGGIGAVVRISTRRPGRRHGRIHKWKTELHHDRISDSGSMRIDVERRRPMTEVVNVDPVRPNQTDIARAADCLRRGGLVAFPTETVYGLGVHALDRVAVRRLFDAKGRPASDPLIVHVSSFSQVAPLVVQLPRNAERLASRFWPGALTLVLHRAPLVPHEVTASRETVAVRVPAHPVAHALLLAASLPVAAPSANLFSRPSPTLAGHVLDDLDGRIDMILDGGPTTVGVESTVVDLTVDPPVVLRPGAISVERLRTEVPAVQYGVPPAPVSDRQSMPSPGLLSKHYAPRAPLTIYRGEPVAVGLALKNGALSAVERGRRVGVLVSDEDAACLRDLADIGNPPFVLVTLASADDAEADRRAIVRGASGARCGARGRDSGARYRERPRPLAGSPRSAPSRSSQHHRRRHRNCVTHSVRSQAPDPQHAEPASSLARSACAR